MKELADGPARAAEEEGTEVLREGGLVFAAPRDEGQLAALVRRAARERLRVVPMGLATKLVATRPEVFESEAGADLLLVSTRHVAGVVDHEPGDGTLTALAGSRMADLDRAVRAGGHRLTPDVPFAERSTLGGVLGTGLSGPDRLRHGPVRHHVLGARLMLADGRTVRSGGRLVKNVTGFDLHRLWCGARGTLGVLVEASLRLVPEPAAEAVLVARYESRAEALERAERLRRLAIQPWALVVENRTGPCWRVHLALAGRAEAVEDERRLAAGVMEGAACHEGANARDRRIAVRDLTALANARLHCRPSRVATALDRLAEVLGELAWSVAVQPAVAVAELHLDEAHPDVWLDLARALASEGARLEPAALPAALHTRLAPRHADRPELRWMRALARAFDPDARFASPTFPCRP